MLPLAAASLLLLLLMAAQHGVWARSCACAAAGAAGKGVAVWPPRPGLLLSPGDCAEVTGHTMERNGVTWVKVTWKKQTGWVPMTHVQVKPCPARHRVRRGQLPSPDPGCPRIISRAEWGARPPKRPYTSLPSLPRNLYIHHGATPGCSTPESCARLARLYQNYHMDSRGWNDIGYSFLVGEDGRVYEGRGWDAVGAHTYRHNSDGLGVCVMGNFQERVPNEAALRALTQFINCAVNLGKIRTDYHLVGHRDVRTTSCPGQAFYDLLQTWPHYSSVPL